MDTTASEATPDEAQAQAFHAPLSVALKVGQRVKAKQGLGVIVRFSSQKMSAGFGRTREVTSVMVRLNSGGRPVPCRAQEISVLKDAG